MLYEEYLWKKFEATGSIDAYLAYSKDRESTEDKEEAAFGNSGDGGNNNQRG